MSMYWPEFPKQPTAGLIPAIYGMPGPKRIFKRRYALLRSK